MNKCNSKYYDGIKAIFKEGYPHEEKNITLLLSCEEEKRISSLMLCLIKSLTSLLFAADRFWDKKKLESISGDLARVLILATFFDIRVPLDRISERFTKVDTEFWGKLYLLKNLMMIHWGCYDRIAEANLERFFAALDIT